MTTLAAFRWTPGELAWAVPAGVVLGAIIAAVGSWLGATRAAKQEALLAVGQRFWDARKDLYLRSVREVHDFDGKEIWRRDWTMETREEVGAYVESL